MDLLKQAVTNLKILQAIEILEYEDSNHLAQSPKKRSEEKLRMIEETLVIIERPAYDQTNTGPR